MNSLDVQDPVCDPQPAECPQHAVDLPGGHWRLWRTLALRGAGFPVGLVLKLEGSGVVAAADQYLAAKRERERRLDVVLDRLREMSAADPEDRPRIRALRRLRRQLRRGVVDAGSADPGQQALAVALQQEKNGLIGLSAAYDSDAATVIEAMSGIASDPLFREAALWQTGKALGYAAKSLGRPQNQKQREAIEFIALVTQRYAVKNDTCGFFGPAGWAELDDGFSGYLRLETAPKLTSCCSVYFEGWTIDALAEVFDRDPDTKRWAVPRLWTSVWLEPEGACLPQVGLLQLPQIERRVLDACDGVRTAHAIALQLIKDDRSPLTTEAEVFEVLGRLAERKVLIWRIEVAPQLHPDRRLKSIIEGIGDRPLRQRCAEALEALLQARDRVAESAGKPDELERSFEHMDETFTRLTGQPPTRRPGFMYAGRNLLYKDCRRAGEVTFGQDFLDQLGPPLSIVLDGGRWFLGEVSHALRGCLRDCHAELAQQLGCDAIDAETFLEHAKSDQWLQGIVRPLLKKLEVHYQAAWGQVLVEPIHDSPHQVAYDVKATAARARRVFQSPKDSWGMARQLSPDVMVSARGADAFQRGEFEFLLGELHLGNTLTWSALAAQHPDLDRLLEWLAADNEGNTVVLKQKPTRGWIARGNQLLILPTFWRYEYGDDLPSLPGCNRLPAGKLLAVDVGNDVKFRTRDGSFEFSALDVFSDWMTPPINKILSNVRPESRHTRRITLGRLTIVRERWDLSASDMPFLAQRDRSRRFAAVRAWAAERGMPRWVFFRAPTEPKPCYLDFDSPAFVEVFVRQMKLMEAAKTVKIVEMKPRVDETWLVDGQGVCYTSELRIVAQPPRTSTSLGK